MVLLSYKSLHRFYAPENITPYFKSIGAVFIKHKRKNKDFPYMNGKVWYLHYSSGIITSGYDPRKKSASIQIHASETSRAERLEDMLRNAEKNWGIMAQGIK